MQRRPAFYQGFGVLALAATFALIPSCGRTKSPTFGLPGQPAPGTANSYVGKPGNSPSDPALWSVSIDRSKNTYSYGSANASTQITGTFTQLTDGFLVLLGQNGYQNGLALEIPGEVILLRPGDTSAGLVFAVQQASCFSIGGNFKFLFAMSPGLPSTNEAVFGRVYAGTPGGANSWQFSNLAEYQAPDGVDIPPNALYPGYPADYPGNCAGSNGSANVNSSVTELFNNGANYSIPTEYVISPSGFFFANQDYSSVPGSSGWTYPDIAGWGLGESPVPVPVGAIATATYLGFLLESNTSNGTYRTRLVGFGNAPISGTTMTGGTFPNEDPTQLPDRSMSVTFGSEDPLNNGLFYFARLAVPYDGGQSTCPTPVPNSNGVLICSYNAVAVASKPNGKFAIVLSAFDPNGNQKTLVLFQP